MAATSPGQLGGGRFAFWGGRARWLGVPPRARRDARQWFDPLSKLSITTKPLWEFHGWRQDADSAADYAELEREWEAGRPSRSPRRTFH